MICSGYAPGYGVPGGTPSDFGVNRLLQAGTCVWLALHAEVNLSEKKDVYMGNWVHSQALLLTCNHCASISHLQHGTKSVPPSFRCIVRVRTDFTLTGFVRTRANLFFLIIIVLHSILSSAFTCARAICIVIAFASEVSFKMSSQFKMKLSNFTPFLLILMWKTAYFSWLFRSQSSAWGWALADWIVMQTLANFPLRQVSYLQWNLDLGKFCVFFIANMEAVQESCAFSCLPSGMI